MLEIVPTGDGKVVLYTILPLLTKTIQNFLFSTQLRFLSLTIQKSTCQKISDLEIIPSKG